MMNSPSSFGKHRCGRRGWKFVLIPVFIAGFIAVKSVAVMYLWNGLIPDLFHGPEVTFLQALGLVVLAKLLIGFGGPHRGPWGRGRWGHRHWGHRGPWGRMTPDEREELRSKLRSKFGEKFEEKFAHHFDEKFDDHQKKNPNESGENT